MTAYIKILRPRNLLMIAASQLIIYYLVIYPTFGRTGLASRLDEQLLSLFVLCTLILAGTSYIINDIADVDADKINKPNQAFIPQAISLANAKIYYYSLISAGLCLAVYIGGEVRAMHLIVIYPIAALLLYAYSIKLKGRGFIGNLIVALFTAFVPGVLLIAEPGLLSQTELEPTRNLIAFFAGFSFLLNLMREVVKDMEDVEGDKLADSQSLPLTAGIEKSKVIVGFLTGSLIVLILLFVSSHFELLTFRSISFLMVFVIALLGVSLARLWKAAEKEEYHKLSTLYKIIMLSGLIFLVIQQSEI